MLVHTRVVAGDLPIFPYRGSRNPSEESRSASDRRIHRVSHPAIRADDFRSHHRTAHPSREPCYPVLDPQSESVLSGETEERAEGREVSDPCKWCKPGLRTVRTKTKTCYRIPPALGMVFDAMNVASVGCLTRGKVSGAHRLTPLTAPTSRSGKAVRLFPLRLGSP